MRATVNYSTTNGVTARKSEVLENTWESSVLDIATEHAQACPACHTFTIIPHATEKPVHYSAESGKQILG